MRKYTYIQQLILVLLSGLSLSASAQTATFNYTGGVQTYQVPSGVSFLTVDAAGAAGGASYYNKGGNGGRVKGTLSVTAGTVIYIYVGGVGGIGTTSSGGSSGYNGGGASTSTYGGGGGGATDIRIGGTALSNRLVVAAGGGGGGYNSGSNYEPGGMGGGLSGGDGRSSGGYYAAYVGNGATQSAGGLAATSGSCTAGTLGNGGSVSGAYGGAGGGGFYGGGGGYYGSGGGGSSYADPTLVTAFSTFMGFNASAGYISFTPASAASTSSVFNYSGTIQTYVVPTGVNYVNVDMTGAAGGRAYYTYGASGAGGRVQCVMAVTPGQVYYLFSGGRGSDAHTSSYTGSMLGGWNGGGASGTYYYGGSGGGASDIRFGGTAISNRVIVAGGGGGGAYNCTYGQDGGMGGGLTGGHGWYCGGTYTYYAPTGGSQAAGGNNGTYTGGSASTQGIGGDASLYYSGGGGGGFYGGGGGAYYGSGGGGSSYPASTGNGISGLLHTQGYNANDPGSITITPVAAPSTTGNFSYNGSIQTYVVPTGVTSINIDMQGGAGGRAYSTYGAGGCGGRVRCAMAVTPGQTYYITVGGKGTDGSNVAGVTPGGFNGGGSGASASYYYGAGGGGATDIRFGGTAISNRIIVAGGGGGAGYSCSGGQDGGAGGGITGGNGLYCSTFNTTYAASGATQSAGGNNGTGMGGSASTQGTGASSTNYYSGGGGGGYWGGGAGYYYGSGGGGSSYPAANGSGITGLVHNQAYNCSTDGNCVITPNTAITTTTSFTYTGSIQTYSVPTGITLLSVDVNGASGGKSYANYGRGGCGGTVTCNVNVTPGQLLYIYSGGRGTSGSSSSGVTAGGWNGGGSGASVSYYYGAGGGGASDIRTGGTAISNRIIVAGGGGGAGYNCSPWGENGGAGGSLTGEVGYYCSYFYNTYSPTGGTQTSGGLNGTSMGGSATTQGTGSSTSNYYAGGGGGGYWGGGAGYYYSGGGGGSSYTDPTAAANVFHIMGNNCSNDGIVNITPICTAGNITGNPSTCIGFTTALTDATTGGVWSSANTGVATVSSTGVVTGVSAGTVIISYGGVLACGTVYSTQLVNVTAPPSAITGSYICQALPTTFTSSAGGTWTTSNTGIATIDPASGIATGVTAGTVTISYSISSTCYVTTTSTVNATSPITGASTVCVGSTVTLSDAMTGGTWTSSNSGLATINSSTGFVTGLNAGTLKISYTLTSGCTVSTPITVNPLPAAISGATSICLGQVTTLTETSVPGKWSSANTAIATVDSVTATTASAKSISAGTTTITYTLPTGCYMATPFAVNPLPTAIIVPATGLCVTNALNAPVALSDASAGGTWVSSDLTVATIGSSSGFVTGLKTGKTIVTYTLPTGCFNTTTINVNSLPGAIKGTGVVCANAITYLANDTIGGAWKSSNNALATVASGVGIVTGVSGYSTPVITYTLPTGCLTLTTVTVNPAAAPITGTQNICTGNSSTLSVSGGGTWTSGNPAVASVTTGPVGGGVVTGIAASTAAITYTLPATGCFSTTTVTVNTTPAVITGKSSVCYGSRTFLNDATLGGTWSTSASTIASVNTFGAVKGLSTTTGTATISYTVASGCFVTQVMTVNVIPTIYNLSALGTPSYCSGGAGIDMQLNASNAGINYQVYVNGVATGGLVAGGTTPLALGKQTLPGTYVMTATNATTGCNDTMTGKPVITVNTAPTAFTLGYNGATSAYCDSTGAAGIELTLSGSQSGMSYQLFDGSGNNVKTVTGTGSGFSFGFFKATGAYKCQASNPGTTCQAYMAGSVTITKNRTPDVKNVLGGGAYCNGSAGVHVSLNYGISGIDYSLYKNGVYAGKTIAGASASVDFGVQYAPGTYTVVGKNATTGCYANMSGNAIVSILPLPDTFHVVVKGGGSYCAGGTGVHILLDSSKTNANYTLMFAGSPVTGASNIAGTGHPFSFADQTIAGVYTVVAANTTTGCATNMAGAATVSAYPALATYTVTASSASFCKGGSGVHIIQGGSATGVRYYLWNNDTLVDGMYGTGSLLDFGARTLTGKYAVTAESIANGCTANMTGNPTINMLNTPSAHNVTVDNSGYYCVGGAGVHIGLDFTDVGVKYQLWKGGAMIGTAKTGANSSVDFGVFSATGAYTIIGTNTLTTCASDMTGSANVTANSIPVKYNITGGGSYCSGSTTGVPVGLINSEAGISYQLYNSGKAIGAPVTGAGSAITFGGQLATGLYTVVAANGLSGCNNTMNGSVVITTNPLPTTYTVTGGGSFCSGAKGVSVGLANSVSGIDYILTLNGTTPVSTVSGTTGKALDFGIQAAAGKYTVSATNVISGCANDMTGNATVIMNATPATYSVIGGGTYCAGDAGMNVSVSGTDAGISYQLYNSGKASGGALSGMGVKLSFGSQTATGTYTAIAIDPATGCSANMSGSVNVATYPSPNAYAVLGGGAMCSGTTGPRINLYGSEAGTAYMLYNSGALTGTTLKGTGGALDFGAQATAGVYTVKAINTYGCGKDMTGNGTIMVNDAPTVFTVNGGGSFCASDSGVLVGLSGSQAGINYSLYTAGSVVGLPVGGTGASVDFGRQKGAGTYTVVGTNTTTTCQSNMAGAKDVIVVPMVKPGVAITGTDDSACIGSTVAYGVNAVNGGAAPTFNWKINGTTVGTGSSYTYIPVDGDIVTVTMTNDTTCAVAPTVATAVTMHSIAYATPSAKITSDHGDAICTGNKVIFSATSSLPGDDATYMWMRNGKFEGNGLSYGYTPNTGDNGDVIILMMHSNYRCRTADTVFSNPIALGVDDMSVPVIDSMSSKVGPRNDVGHTDTFAVYTKSNSSAVYSYQWFINGAVVTGENSPIFIDHGTFNNDIVTVEVTKSGACGDRKASQQFSVELYNLGASQVAVNKGNINIAPNPNNGTFSIKGTTGSNATEDVTEEVTNMLGQVVYKNTVKANQGTIEDRVKLDNIIANGMYLLNLKTTSGLNTTFHIVIER